MRWLRSIWISLPPLVRRDLLVVRVTVELLWAWVGKKWRGERPPPLLAVLIVWVRESREDWWLR